jgi:hypothetical protein
MSRQWKSGQEWRQPQPVPLLAAITVRGAGKSEMAKVGISRFAPLRAC